VLSSQFAHERAFAHRGETNEANTGNTGSGNIKANTGAAASTTARVKQLSLEFGEFCFQLP
jgi:hypothetical protein